MITSCAHFGPIDIYIAGLYGPYMDFLDHPDPIGAYYTLTSSPGLCQISLMYAIMVCLSLSSSSNPYHVFAVDAGL